MDVTRKIKAVLDQLNTVMAGKPGQVQTGVACLLAGGHLLIEDVPGVGKTTLAHALARTFGLQFSRVQFTADLMPSDLSGVSVYDRGQEAFVFHPGPVFAQVLLADEINRASPKTQSALLEAMEERQVTVEGQTRALPRPFFVIATQNPHDQLGTYALPESQLDRFLMRISLGYPERGAERALLAGNGRRDLLDALPAVLFAAGPGRAAAGRGRGARGRAAAGLRAGRDRRHALGPLVPAGAVAARRHRLDARGTRPGADCRARLRGAGRRAGRAATAAWRTGWCRWATPGAARWSRCAP